MQSDELFPTAPPQPDPVTKPPRTADLPIYQCSLVRDGTVRAQRMIDTPARAVETFRAMIGDSAEEVFCAAAVDARNRVIGLFEVSRGTVSASLVHPREVFKRALLLNAAGVLVAHNHPSGDSTPSSEDRECTKRLVQGGKLLGVPVLDHVILGEGEKYFSFREGGLI